MTNWSNIKIDVQDLNNQLKEIENNTGDYPEVPNGKYEVEIVNMELKPTKKDGFPMLAVQFKILEGEYKKFNLFMNQVLIMGDQNDKYRVNNCNQFLNSLDTDLPIHFDGVQEYDELVQKVFAQVQKEKLQYLLELGENKGGYKTFTIKDVYETDPHAVQTDDAPF